MYKKIIIENLDCAHCAAKIEEKLNSIKGINEATVNFIAGTITLDYDDNLEKSVIKEVKKACKRVEPDCELIYD